ncbi:elicitor-responsive protein 3 [Pyrus x bretschneideri]|uniref:elicitor-responsive protein 3 n=1 Tax=Pyrus x bretschneideri TaxID=225117 RepID=UPI002030577C|nr:elicitor-responsive protein 3 [Pyrus x bretschneideri]
MAPRGTLEVQLVGAKELKNMDVAMMDPYCVITYKDQQKKSGVARGQGSMPDWNETLLFTIAGAEDDLGIKIYDQDSGSLDDYVGELKIPLDAIVTDTGCEGRMPPTPYEVMRHDKVKGEITIGLYFNPEPGHENRGDCCDDEEEEED